MSIIKQTVIILIALLISNVFSQTININVPDTLRIFNLENCVNQFDSTKTIKTKVGYQYWFVDKAFLNGRTLKMSVVGPHSATHEPHKHAEDEFFFILEGKAEFYLDGETIKAIPYASFYCPANSLHGIRNVGETDLKYLVIKKYLQKQ